MYKFKKDSYQKARGGTSKILDVSCERCAAHVAFYQKDGPGILKRMYQDRFIDFKPSQNQLFCQICNTELGIKINYKKEDRPAYRLFAGAITKKIITKTELAKVLQ